MGALEVVSAEACPLLRLQHARPALGNREQM